MFLRMGGGVVLELRGGYGGIDERRESRCGGRGRYEGVQLG